MLKINISPFEFTRALLIYALADFRSAPCVFKPLYSYNFEKEFSKNLELRVKISDAYCKESGVCAQRYDVL